MFMVKFIKFLKSGTKDFFPNFRIFTEILSTPVAFFKIPNLSIIFET